VRPLLAALAFLCSLAMSWSMPWQAARAQPLSESVGAVAIVRAPASLERPGSATPLKVGDDVFPNDTFVTGAGGEIGIVFDDETALILGGNASITVDEFVYQARSRSNKGALSIGRGTLAFFANRLAKTGEAKIHTAVAILGIRGTSGIVDVPETANVSQQVKLYPDPNRTTGRILVSGRDGRWLGTLTVPTSGLTIAGDAARPTVRPLTISPQQAALDRALLERVFAMLQGVGRQLLDQRLQRIPELQERLGPPPQPPQPPQLRRGQQRQQPQRPPRQRRIQYEQPPPVVRQGGIIPGLQIGIGIGGGIGRGPSLGGRPQYQPPIRRPQHYR
jgi:hypothetical protein